mgnify:CR=1 FL=1
MNRGYKQARYLPVNFNDDTPLAAPTNDLGLATSIACQHYNDRVGNQAGVEDLQSGIVDPVNSRGRYGLLG